MLVEKFNACAFALLRQLFGKHAGITAFIGFRESAARYLVGVRRECRLDLEQFFATDQTALHTVLAHQLHAFGGFIKGFLAAVEMGNAALQPLELDAGLLDHVFERSVAVGAQGHDLLHIARKGFVIALTEELQAPAPLRRVQLRAKQQRRFFVEHPFERLPRCLAAGPRLAVAHGYLRAIGKAGLQRGAGLAVHHGDLMAALAQMPGGADADDAGAEDDDVHALSVCTLAHI